MDDIAAAVRRLMPAGDWAPEWLVKCGEGGTFQRALGDSHPLAIGGQSDLEQRVAQGKAAGIRVVPYIVVRGRPAWSDGEWRQIAQCAKAAGKVVLNLEEGLPYFNGPTTPEYAEFYLQNMWEAIGQLTDPSKVEIELCAIPRQWVVDALGGNVTMRVWLSHVQRASWETYGRAAPDLMPEVALPRVDAWAPTSSPLLRIPLVQRNMIADYADSPLAKVGLACWFLDGDI